MLAVDLDLFAMLDEFVHDRPRDQRFQPAAHQNIGLQPAGRVLVDEAQRMLRPGLDNVTDIGAEGDAPGCRRLPDTFISTATKGASTTRMPTFSTGVTR